VAEEAVEILTIEAMSANVVTMEPEFSLLIKEMAGEKGWTRIQRAAPDEELDLIIALDLKNLDVLEERLLAAATPGNPEYGKWLTKGEISKLTSPPKEAIDHVLDWFGASAEHYHDGGFIKKVVTVEVAEKLLNSEYHVFRHTSGQEVIRMLDTYAVDSSVADHISFASPSIRFPAKSEMGSKVIYEEMDIDLAAVPISNDLDDSDPKKGDPIDAELDSQPYYIRTLYNITATGSRTDNRQAVAEFLTQIFSQDDQNTFYNRFYPKGAGTEITMKGRTVEQEGDYAGIETMLDTEYITVTGTGIPTENWSYMYDQAKTGRQTCPFLDWVLDVGDADDETVPKVFSISYGDDELYVSTSYANRISAEFMKAGARGISILFASGDSGANCIRNTFIPDFPAGSPYVTAVGGTRGGGQKDIDSWRLSSGGFSNIFHRPSWQEAAVSKYMEDEGNMGMAKLYDANIENGRGFPDVSAMAVGYPVVCTGKAWLISGTSCAAPVFAGIIALLNDHLLNNGKSTLGFLNPWLYSANVRKTLVDVLEDYNEGCTPKGWSASKGWDPVTGLGFPNFGNMRDLL
jgi:tripeptidyl-peptidase-1